MKPTQLSTIFATACAVVQFAFAQVPLTPEACSAEPSLKSLESATLSEIDFSNATAGVVKISWLDSGFPTHLPLRESPRRIQLLLRFEF